MLPSNPTNRQIGRRVRRNNFRQGQDRGFTLIELLLTVAIFGIALAGIFAFLIWGYRTFRTGADKTELHRHLNMASELITGEVRYATGLELLDDWEDLPSGPAGIEPDEHYLYYDQKEGAIVLLDQGGSRHIGGPYISSAGFYLEKGLFHYDLEASGVSEYTLESTVLLLNTRRPISSGEPIPAVRYTKP